MSNITKTTQTYGPYIITYTSEGDVTITQQPTVHPLMVTPMVVGTRSARTVTPVTIVPVWEETEQYRRDMALADRASIAFSRLLEHNEVEGFIAS